MAADCPWNHCAGECQCLKDAGTAGLNPTSTNMHVCHTCGRALYDDQGQSRKYQVGELALTFGKRRYRAENLCGACVDSLRETMQAALRMLRP